MAAVGGIPRNGVSPTGFPALSCLPDPHPFRRFFPLSFPALHPFWAILGAYALGCFSTGYYLVRWRLHRDVRDEGSGSTGARNVGRLLGRGGFLLTVVGDVLKGFLAVGIPRLAGLPPVTLPLSALAATLGHIFPAQLRFRGGKGIAVALASLMVVDPRYVLVVGVSAGAVYLLARRAVLASLLGMLAVPVAAGVMGKGGGEVVALASLAVVILLAHRRNIRSLLQGGSGAGA